MTSELIRLAEPQLLFNHSQAMEDPRDGLTLFGPLEQGSPLGIRAGIVGTKAGISKFQKWTERIQLPVRTRTPVASRPVFPGFESAFRKPWNPQPLQAVEIDDEELKKALYQDDRYRRVYDTVELFAGAIIRTRDEEEAKPDLWFVVIPDEVKKYCRPQSIIEPEIRHEAKRYFASSLKANIEQAKRLQQAPSLFPDDNVEAEPYSYKEHFRNQLKARLLPDRIATQVVRESTVENIGYRGHTRRELGEELLQSQIAWNMSTTAFYKVGGLPWKLSGIRDGVAYIGLVFKHQSDSSDTRFSVCGAQMFLHSGDGVVFKGTPGGAWYNEKYKEFHLTKGAASDLIKKAMKSYKEKHQGSPPRELFIHGQTRFNDEEWAGFCEAVDSRTNVVAVRIRDDKGIKLYRKTDNPVLRGTAYIIDSRRAYLWTRGWTPRLRTYPGMEVPNPLGIEISHGEVAIETVLRDVLALTKLNYNTCRYGDGKPITLKFADAVGEVLIARKLEGIPPLPFMYYI